MVEHVGSLLLFAELGEEPVCGEKRVCLSYSCRGAITAPLPFLRLFSPMSPNGVKDNVPAQFEKIAVFIDNDLFVPSLEDVAGLLVLPVVSLGIDAVYLSHSPRKVSLRGFNDQMVVVIHETIGMAEPMKSLDNTTKKPQEIEAIFVVPENLSGLRSQVTCIECALVFKAEKTGHRATIAHAKVAMLQ